MNAHSTPLAADPSLTPGGYLRSCRRRAGLSRRDCAERIALRELDRLNAEHDLRRLEANRPGDYGRLVRALCDFAVFPFDFTTFVALAAETTDPELGEPGAAA